MTEAAKDWTAEQWAEWAAGFISKDNTDHVVYPVGEPAISRRDFNPLHDANHLMLVLDEIERRGWKWTLDTMCSMKEYTMELYRDEQENIDSGPWPTIHLAVLLAAHELQERTRGTTERKDTP